MPTALRTSVIFLFVALALLLGAGCSPSARKARHLQAGDRYFTASELDKAEVEYLNVLKIEPVNSRAIGQLGLIYAEEGRTGRAIAFLVKAHELAPEDLAVRLKFGQINLLVGRNKEAQDEANYILDRRPQDPEAPLLLASATTNPREAEVVQQRLQSLPAPAAAGAPVLTALGLLELRRGQPKEAEALLKQAVAADTKFAAAYAIMGTLYLARNNRAAAEPALRQAAEYSPLRSNRRLQYAQFKLRTGDAAEGKRLLEEMTQKTPDYLPAWTARAEIALGEKKYDECAGLIEKALARDSENFEILILRARLRLAKGETDRAIDEFERLSTAYPKMSGLLFELARAYLTKGETDKALDRVNQAVNLTPGFTEAILLQASLNLRKGDAATAIVQLRQLLQQRPDLPQAQLLLAEAYRNRGSLDDALALYRQLEEKTPQAPQPPFLRGVVLLRQKKLPEARQAFTRALELAPDNLPALEQLVNVDLLEKKYGPALERVEAAIKQRPQTAGAGELLKAKVFLAQGDTTRAEAALKKSIELQPDVPTAYFMLAGLYLDTRQQDKALANLREAIAHNPKDTNALVMMGIIQEQQKDYPAAREAYEKVLALNPNSFIALNNLACLDSQQFNQPDQAYELAQKARNLQPHEPHTADTLGWILYRKGQYAWALSLLQEAAEKLPDAAEVQYHLGMAHYMMGQEQPARAALQRARQIGGEFTGRAEAEKSLALLDTDITQAGNEVRAGLEKAVAERKDDPVALTRLAAIDERAGNPAKAISLLESVLQSNASNVNALLSLSRLYAGQKNPARALETAKAARKLAPDDPQIAHTLGRLAYQAGDYGWAASLLEEATRKNPDNPEWLFDLAQAVYSVGRVPDAESALRGALHPPGGAGSLTLFSRAGDARQLLDWISLAANPAEAQKQSSRIAQTLQSDPAYVPALMAAGTASEGRGEADSARQDYEKVLAQYPDFTPAKLRLALLGAARMEFDQKTYDRALQARSAYPQDAALAKALGILTYYKGDYARAAALLRESLVARPGDPELLCYLGLVQYNLKDADAKAALQRALAANPRPELAAEVRQTLAKLK